MGLGRVFVFWTVVVLGLFLFAAFALCLESPVFHIRPCLCLLEGCLVRWGCSCYCLGMFLGSRLGTGPGCLCSLLIVDELGCWGMLLSAHV